MPVRVGLEDTEVRDQAIMRAIGSNRPVFGRTSHCNRERRTHLFGGRILLGPLRAFRVAAGKSVGRGGSTSVASPLFLAISRSTMVVVSMRRPRGQDDIPFSNRWDPATSKLLQSMGGDNTHQPRGDGPGRRASSRPPPKWLLEQGGASVTLQGPSVAGCRQGGQRSAPHRIAPPLPVWQRWPTADGDLRPPPAG